MLDIPRLLVWYIIAASIAAILLHFLNAFKHPNGRRALRLFAVFVAVPTLGMYLAFDSGAFGALIPPEIARYIVAALVTFLLAVAISELPRRL